MGGFKHNNCRFYKTFSLRKTCTVIGANTHQKVCSGGSRCWTLVDATTRPRVGMVLVARNNYIRFFPIQTWVEHPNTAALRALPGREATIIFSNCGHPKDSSEFNCDDTPIGRYALRVRANGYPVVFMNFAHEPVGCICDDTHECSPMADVHRTAAFYGRMSLVLRDYWTPVLYDDERVHMLPTPPSGAIDVPLKQLTHYVSRPVDKRSKLWFFLGSAADKHFVPTDTKTGPCYGPSRQNALRTLQNWSPYGLPTRLKPALYIRELGNTIFSICPKGTTFTTFRFAESLIAGAIPIVDDNNTYFKHHFSEDLNNMLIRTDWRWEVLRSAPASLRSAGLPQVDDAMTGMPLTDFLDFLLADNGTLEAYRVALIEAYETHRKLLWRRWYVAASQLV